MPSEYVHQICHTISESRIGPYRQQATANDLLSLSAYAWNVALCESLYPVLNGLEITLRKHIHYAASDEFGDEYWFDRLRTKKSKDALQKARKKLGASFTSGDMVAQLNFGFWAGLFDSQYEEQLWRKLLKPVFPGVPNQHRTRGRLSKRLYHIRLLRNRVFHHEPVWSRGDLTELHGQILETIGWISPIMRQFVEMLDRFPETYDRGAEFYEQELLSVVQS